MCSLHDLVIHECVRVARARGGDCLGAKILTQTSVLVAWSCANGHVWWNTHVNVCEYKQWCPKCPALWASPQHMIAAALEETTCARFDKMSIRIDNILVPMDGFSAAIKVGFDYCGANEDCQSWGASKLHKRRLCAAAGVKLILVHHDVCAAGYNALCKFILDELQSQEIPILGHRRIVVLVYQLRSMLAPMPRGWRKK